MNCGMGDLARVIDSPATRRVGYVDHFIRVTTSVVGRDGFPQWRYEGPKLPCKCGCGALIESFADSILRPIRNPGDDAIDQTLIWKPVPMKETA